MVDMFPPEDPNEPIPSMTPSDSKIPRRFTFILFEDINDDPISLHTLKKSLTSCLHPHDRQISFIREVALSLEDMELLPISYDDMNIHEMSEEG